MSDSEFTYPVSGADAVTPPHIDPEPTQGGADDIQQDPPSAPPPGGEPSADPQADVSVPTVQELEPYTPAPVEPNRDIVNHLVAGEPFRVKVICTDSPGPGGACHEYLVVDEASDILASVHFQKGPVKESGPNGVTMESLLAILTDRLAGFQCGEYKCYDNAQALGALTTALHFLKHRTQERINRGIEGTSTV